LICISRARPSQRFLHMDDQAGRTGRRIKTIPFRTYNQAARISLVRRLGIDVLNDRDNKQLKRIKRMISNRNKLSHEKTAALSAAVALTAIFFTSMTALGDEPTGPEQAENSADDTKAGSAPQHAGFAANMYFTDEDGNRRQPTAEEVRRAAEAAQRDLARLAGQHKDKPNIETRPDGTVSATVAVSKLVFLSVEETEDGGLSYGHASMDANGKVHIQPSKLPEK
jgi:hypothetical protein